MNPEKLPVGDDFPQSFYAVVEIPMWTQGVKYEFDTASGMVLVDRFTKTPMRYPVNYGFIPHTLGLDGDPLDALILTSAPLVAGSAIKCRTVGVLKLEDESGMDDKILCLPDHNICPVFGSMADQDIPEATYEEIEYFFTHYKDLETHKWSKVYGWKDDLHAKELILAAHQRK